VSIKARRFSRTTLVVCSLFICAGFLHADDRRELKKGLLKATVRAIELEIEATRDRLKAAEGGTGPSENVERFTQKLRGLEAEQARFAGMKPDEYPEPVQQSADSYSILEQSEGFGPVLPPVTREVVVNVDGPLGDGVLLSVEGASKSGPFYHLAGIAGGSYAIVKEGTRYRLTLCLVYRREYFGLIGDYYAYVVSVR
jgi:hypothetical protein